MQNIMINHRILLDFEWWYLDHLTAPRLQRHEAMKAILFKYNRSASLEVKIPIYNSSKGRTGIVDYMDNELAIEIDDGTNIKSVQKLYFCKEKLGKKVLWILLLHHGHGRSSIRRAREYGIPVLRLYLANSKFRWDFTV